MLVISAPATILAQDEGVGERILILANYTKIEILSGESCEFKLEIEYIGEVGDEPRVFDLTVTGPKDWYVYIHPNYPKDVKIRSIQLKPGPPGYRSPSRIGIVAVPAYWLKPEPGEYQILLEVSSDELSFSYELTAVVVATYTYILNLVPTTERYSTSAIVDRDNYFTAEVKNDGSATIEDVTFSSIKPEGWTIEFSPNRVDSIGAGSSQTIEINLKPPSGTMAGDYRITLTAEGKQVSAEELDIRVTVKTPTIWGWVGAGIVLLVIAGMVFVFMRFSRR